LPWLQPHQPCGLPWTLVQLIERSPLDQSLLQGLPLLAVRQGPWRRLLLLLAQPLPQGSP